MWSRPSRSLKSTVTALIRVSSVRYLIRSSWILCAATRLWRCSFAFRFNCSSSSYERARKLRNSFDMNLPISSKLFKSEPRTVPTPDGDRHRAVSLSRRFGSVKSKNRTAECKKRILERLDCRGARQRHSPGTPLSVLTVERLSASVPYAERHDDVSM